MANARCQWNRGLQEVLISPWLKTTKTPQIVTSGVRILLHYAVTKSAPKKIMLRGLAHGLTSLPVQHVVEEHKHADQHRDVSPHPSDHAAGTKNAKSKKKKKKKHENGGRVLS
jgi:hypothetical protein